MNIGVDIRTLSFRKGGISQYVYHLVKNMVRADPNKNFYLFNFTKGPYDWDHFGGNVKEVVLRLPQRHGMRTLWENMLVPIAVKKLRIDVWFGPDFFIPRSLDIPTAVTVHDLIFMNFHNMEKNRPSRALFSRVFSSIRKAHKVIVPSRFTGEEVRKAFEVADHRITVIPEAADERFHKIEDLAAISRVLERYKIRFPYVLFVGETSRRKNLIRLLHAFRLLKTENRLGQRRLLIAGKRTIDTDRIMQEVRNLGLTSHVFFTGYVPDEDLPFIYCGADLFVFPSLYEGFGLPLLEAMRCLTPVAASNATAIPEVVGDGALLFDPLDVHDMAAKIEQIINRRVDVEALRRKGRLRAENFSWAESAGSTLEVFNEIHPHSP